MAITANGLMTDTQSFLKQATTIATSKSDITLKFWVWAVTQPRLRFVLSNHPMLAAMHSATSGAVSKTSTLATMVPLSGTFHRPPQCAVCRLRVKYNSVKAIPAVATFQTPTSRARSTFRVSNNGSTVTLTCKVRPVAPGHLFTWAAMELQAPNVEVVLLTAISIKHLLLLKSPTSLSQTIGTRSLSPNMKQTRRVTAGTLQMRMKSLSTECTLPLNTTVLPISTRS